MMRGGFRRYVAAVCAALLLLAGAAPSGSAADLHADLAEEATSPPMFDLLILRPVGIIGAGISTLLFLVPVVPLTLLTRPSEIGKPFDKMVVQPVRYVIADPIGKH